MENPSFRKDIDFAGMPILLMARALFCGHIDGSGIIPCVIGRIIEKGTLKLKIACSQKTARLVGRVVRLRNSRMHEAIGNRHPARTGNMVW